MHGFWKFTWILSRFRRTATRGPIKRQSTKKRANKEWGTLGPKERYTEKKKKRNTRGLFEQGREGKRARSAFHIEVVLRNRWNDSLRGLGQNNRGGKTKCALQIRNWSSNEYRGKTRKVIIQVRKQNIFARQPEEVSDKWSKTPPEKTRRGGGIDTQNNGFGITQSRGKKWAPKRGDSTA